jgi:hypothetical protein
MMRYFKCKWICPECGLIHSCTIGSKTIGGAARKFELYWRECNEITGSWYQLPLLAITAAEGRYDD